MGSDLYGPIVSASLSSRQYEATLFEHPLAVFQSRPIATERDMEEYLRQRFRNIK